MKCICIRSYPYTDDDELKFYQSFSVNNEYDYTKIYINNQTWYKVNSLYYEELFEDAEFSDYFMTLSDLRRIKIQQINKKP